MTRSSRLEIVTWFLDMELWVELAGHDSPGLSQLSKVVLKFLQVSIIWPEVIRCISVQHLLDIFVLELRVRSHENNRQVFDSDVSLPGAVHLICLLHDVEVVAVEGANHSFESLLRCEACADGHRCDVSEQLVEVIQIDLVFTWSVKQLVEQPARQIGISLEGHKIQLSNGMFPLGLEHLLLVIVL